MMCSNVDWPFSLVGTIMRHFDNYVFSNAFFELFLNVLCISPLYALSHDDLTL